MHWHHWMIWMRKVDKELHLISVLYMLVKLYRMMQNQLSGLRNFDYDKMIHTVQLVLLVILMLQHQRQSINIVIFSSIQRHSFGTNKYYILISFLFLLLYYYRKTKQ